MSSDSLEVDWVTVWLISWYARRLFKRLVKASDPELAKLVLR